MPKRLDTVAMGCYGCSTLVAMGIRVVHCLLCVQQDTFVQLSSKKKDTKVSFDALSTNQKTESL